MKILIIGFGSIGRRHYKNLLKLGFKNVYVYDAVQARTADCGLRVEKPDLAALKEFGAVFICSPNNSHLQQALQCAQAGCHLFIEKPLSHNLRGIGRLEKICGRKKLVNMVACNMRFHPCLQFVKKYLDSKKLGQIYSISHEFGYYLPYWRPGADYTKNYAAKKSTGGGIILDDIHEFDLLFWLNNFAAVEQSKFIFSKLSNLKIETEDACVASFKFKNKVIGSVRCDYLQQSESRKCKIVGEKGNLEVDLPGNTVYLNNSQGGKKIYAVNRKDDNDDFIAEIKYFLNCVEKNQNTINNIKTARDVLKYCVNKK